jgi:DNA-binding NarL/FixJ family response regulator
MTTKAVVLDPHPILHIGIQQVLRRTDIYVAAATTSTGRALYLVARHHPELLVIEPVVSGGLSCIERALKADSMLTVVALSGGDEQWWRQAALSRGAAAFVSKSSPISTIEAAIRDALEATRCGDGTVVSSLTHREREILSLVAEHRTNAEVAQMLWLSPETVKFHVANAFRKLHVSSRTEAARWARRHGLTEREQATAEPLLPATGSGQAKKTTRALAGRQSER